MDHKITRKVCTIMAKRENFRTRPKQDYKEPNGKDVTGEKWIYSTD